MKKDRNLPNKNFHRNKSSGKRLPKNSNYSRQQAPDNTNYRRISLNQKKITNFLTKQM